MEKTQGKTLGSSVSHFCAILSITGAVPPIIPHVRAGESTKAKAIEIGNTKLASTYAAKLGRISEANSKAELVREDRADFIMHNSQLDRIDQSLRKSMAMRALGNHQTSAS